MKLTASNVIQLGLVQTIMRALLVFGLLALWSIQCLGQEEIESPDEIEGLVLWLRADSNLVIDESGLHWEDVRLTGVEMIQIDELKTPSSIVQPILDYHTTLRFDGVADVLECEVPFEIGTIIVLCNFLESEFNQYRGLISGTVGDANSELLVSNNSGTTFYPGAVFSSNVIINQVQTRDFVPLPKYKVVAGYSPNSTNVPGLLIGQDRYIASRFWNGDVAEVLIYEQELTLDQINSLSNYLYDYYGTTASLGGDIELVDFCPIEFEVEDYFESFEWGDGSEDSTFSAMSGTDVVLNGVNEFGVYSTDTVRVSDVGHYINSFSLCQSTDSLWDTGLSEADGFSFVWDTPSPNTGPSVLIDQAGLYNVVITDSEGCTREASVEVSLDNFPSSTSLGPDTELCSGNTISLLSGGEDAQSILWNDNVVAQDFPVIESGQYWVEAINENGCLARDTIEVTIIGEAPTAEFSFSDQCFMSETQFSNLSSAPAGETLESSAWSFGDDEFSSDFDALHTYGLVDTFQVSLSVTTSAGCVDEYQEEVIIHPLPEVALDFQNACHDQPTMFQDISTVETGFIINSEWIFEEVFEAQGEEVEHIFSMPGAYPILLISTSDKLCRDSISLDIQVNGSPVSSFESDGVCIGDPSVFVAMPDASLSGPIQSYLWDFGGFTSIFPETGYTFTSPGLNPVTLSVTSVLGCADDTTLFVAVSNDPLAGFETGPACAGNEVQFFDTSSTSFGDEIDQWTWFFESLAESTDESPTFTFESPGDYDITLNVVSEAGCDDQVSREITVHEDPVSSFTFEPTIGSSPLTPEFLNESQGGQEYLWTFDLGATSSDFIPVHTFLDSGVVSISLEVINEFGCSDISTGNIFLTEPITDIALLNLACERVGDFIRPIITARNLSNYALEGFDVLMEISQGAIVSESYMGLLDRNETRIIELNSSIYFDEASELPFLCVELIPSEGRSDSEPENNRLCKSLNSLEDEVFVIGPHPNPAASSINFSVINASEDKLQLSLFDRIGRPVLEQTMGLNDQLVEDFVIDVTRFSPGLYLMRLDIGLLKFTYKIEVLGN